MHPTLNCRKINRNNLWKCKSVYLMHMCLAIPAKVTEMKGQVAGVDFGEGIHREVDVTLVETKVGDYVLVHAGYAIQVLSKEEAQETLRLWNEILQAPEEEVHGSKPKI